MEGKLGRFFQFRGDSLLPLSENTRMELVLTAATPFEIAPVFAFLEKRFDRRNETSFVLNNLQVTPLVTGVGMTATAFALGRLFAHQRPDLCINAGIAGALNRSLQLGDVVTIRTERFADLGVEESDGRFTDLFELGLIDETRSPIFQQGVMHNPGAAVSGFLPVKNGITVNKVHGFTPSIEALRAKYPDAEVESMEGAAFFYACLAADVPFLEIRSISNYVESRNRDAWDLPLAIERLNAVLVEMVGMFGM